MFFVALAAGALLSAVLALALLREVRLRRALEAVLRRLPGIARTIREYFRILLFFLLPQSRGRHCENARQQFDDLRQRLERETDYEQAH
jgi:hypothetical protein